MKNIFEQLTDLLKKDERLVSQDGVLLKNQIQELARKNDSELIKLLLSDKAIKQHFFFEVEKTLIFDKEKFIRFISNKQFLPDSYTAFKNKIGLIAGEEYLSENKEVVLAWPYRDCVLEGGMTKEDQKRDEIFYNETLAPDDINRLLEAKVFTNFKRIDKKGEHKLDGFKRDEKGAIKDNLIIKGNNLLALASLKKEFAGKMKLIYIDPPFNTDTDSFRYNDRFSRSTWLTFMKNRLELARELLHTEGSIFVHIDHNESHYLKVLLDTVFKEENFRNEIIWRYRRWPSPSKDFQKMHDIIFRYSRSGKWTWNQLYESKSESTLKAFGNIKLSTEITDRGTVKKIKTDEISKGTNMSDVWESPMLQGSASKEREISDHFSTQKPEQLIEKIISSATNEGDMVLDFFAGSGTTAATALKMKRQFITIEQLEYINDVTTERIKKVICGDQSGISKNVNWKGGGDFVYMELAKWNEDWLEKIKKAKTGKELTELWNEMKDTAFLSYKVDPKTIDENTKVFADLSIADQKKFLIECLDKNQLYVNLSEIEDREYGVSKENIRLNKEFYG